MVGTPVMAATPLKCHVKGTSKAPTKATAAATPFMCHIKETSKALRNAAAIVVAAAVVATATCWFLEDSYWRRATLSCQIPPATIPEKPAAVASAPTKPDAAVPLQWALASSHYERARHGQMVAAGANSPLISRGECPSVAEALSEGNEYCSVRKATLRPTGHWEQGFFQALLWYYWFFWNKFQRFSKDIPMFFKNIPMFFEKYSNVFQKGSAENLNASMLKYSWKNLEFFKKIPIFLKNIPAY